MNYIEKAVSKAFQIKYKRGWEKIYIAIDIHNTIVPEGKRERDEDFPEWFPGAVDALRHICWRQDVITILWTSSHKDSVDQFRENAIKKYGIPFSYVNENPECKTNELSNFDSKFYFNILLDDKAGFDGNTDWFFVKKAFEKYDCY